MGRTLAASPRSAAWLIRRVLRDVGVDFRKRRSRMSTPTVNPPESQLDDGYKPGLEGVVAFRTQIAEPDRDGGALRYRGVDIEDLVGHATFGNVWSLLVDGRFGPGLPPAEPFPIPVHTGNVRVDVQAGLAMLAPIWGFE